MKDASNLASFYGSHIDGIISVKQIDIKEILNFQKKLAQTLISLLHLDS